MKKVKDEDLDKLFRSGFEDPANEPVYREADWEAMEQVLDEGKKRPVILIWMPWIGAAAAVILVLLGWLLFRSPNTPGNNKNDQPVAVNKNPKGHTGTSGGATRPLAADSISSKQKESIPADLATNPVHHGEAKDTKRSYPYRQVTPAATLPGKSDQLAATPTGTGQNKKDAGNVNEQKPIANTNVYANSPAPANGVKKESGTADSQTSSGNPSTANALASNSPAVTPGVKPDAGNNAASPVNGNPVAAANAGQTDKTAGQVSSDNGAKANTLANTPPKPKGTAHGFNPNRAVFAISAIATSDLNGVNGMQGGRIGGNLGGLFSVSAGKWTIRTGAMYSIKPYQESFSNYHTNYVFNTPPSSIGVNCKMLDIPLNINYQVYKKQANRITIGTGLSSYIILREDYSFNYNNAYAYGPTGYSVINKNRNILSVMNLDATFDHQINSKFGITFEPYVKLPFTNVGASQAKLQSAGIAVSLNYNLNPFKKPN